MTKEDLTNLVFSRFSPGKGEEAAGELRPQIYAVIDKAIKALAVTVAKSPRSKELQTTFEVTIVAGKGTLDPTIIPSAVVDVFVEGAIGNEEIAITPTYVNMGGGIFVSPTELWGNGRLQFPAQAGFSVDYLASPSSVNGFAYEEYGLNGNFNADNAIEQNVLVGGINHSGNPANILAIVVRDNPGNPSVKQVVWTLNGTGIWSSTTVPQFPLRPAYNTASHPSTKLYIPQTAVASGQARLAPSFGEMQSLSTVNQHFYVVEGSQIYLRTTADKFPNNTIKVKSNYIPDISVLPSSLEEDLIDEVIKLIRGNDNGNDSK